MKKREHQSQTMKAQKCYRPQIEKDQVIWIMDSRRYFQEVLLHPFVSIHLNTEKYKIMM